MLLRSTSLILLRATSRASVWRVSKGTASTPSWTTRSASTITHCMRCLLRRAVIGATESQDCHHQPSQTLTLSEFRYAPPRFVVVLENSAMMGSQWDLVRVMTRNLILEQEYLPDSASLGIVMFSAAAYTEHPVVALSSANRQSLSLSIRSKHNLSPSTDNCVICGVRKAVEALHGESGVIILISRGGQSVRSAGEEPGHSADIWSLADKHRLR